MTFRNRQASALKARLDSLNISKKSAIYKDPEENDILVAIAENPEGGEDVYFFNVVEDLYPNDTLLIEEVSQDFKFGGWVPAPKPLSKPFLVNWYGRYAIIKNKYLSLGYKVTAQAKIWDGKPVIESNF